MSTVGAVKQLDSRNRRASCNGTAYCTPRRYRAGCNPSVTRGETPLTIPGKWYDTTHMGATVSSVGTGSCFPITITAHGAQPCTAANAPHVVVYREGASSCAMKHDHQSRAPVYRAHGRCSHASCLAAIRGPGLHDARVHVTAGPPPRRHVVSTLIW